MIKYDIDGLKCLTKCYFVDETHIGSYYCTTKCPYFIKNSNLTISFIVRNIIEKKN
ncbi:hypothetical protein M0Q97_10525 [Candidatus Dojkabacteria bacterium]|nr:hypothetical protein [Candidatus Dojkabacteria bacterium]